MASNCRCHNHMGTDKQRFRTREDALEFAMGRVLAITGYARIYECPESDRFHVTTRRERKRA